MPKITDHPQIHPEAKAASTAKLNNKLGITDRAKLDKVERMFSYLRMIELNDKQIVGREDLITGLQTVNQYLFQDVYDWAGELRQGNHHGYGYSGDKPDKDYHYDQHHIEYKTASNSKDFISELWDENNVHLLKYEHYEAWEVYDSPRNMKELLSSHATETDKSNMLRRENLVQQFEQDNYLENLGIEQFCEKAGYYLYNLKDTHHFFKGNKETQYTFINQLARKNEYQIAWENISALQLKHTYRENIPLPSQNVAEVNLNSHLALGKLISENIVDKSYSFAVQKYIKDSGTNMQQAEVGKTYYGNIIGITERFTIQKTNDDSVSSIIHNSQNLTKNILPGEACIKISYPYNQTGLVSEPRENDKSVNKNMQKELAHNYER